MNRTDLGADGPVDGEPGYPGMPRWVKIMASIVALIFVLILVLIFIRVPGEHGPGRHFSVQVPDGHVRAPG